MEFMNHTNMEYGYVWCTVFGFSCLGPRTFIAFDVSELISSIFWLGEMRWCGCLYMLMRGGHLRRQFAYVAVRVLVFLCSVRFV